MKDACKTGDTFDESSMIDEKMDVNWSNLAR